jgi:hypothetical protein
VVLYKEVLSVDSRIKIETKRVVVWKTNVVTFILRDSADSSDQNISERYCGTEKRCVLKVMLIFWE